MNEAYGDRDVRLEEGVDLREESLTRLITRLAKDAQTLIQQELALAKTEMREQVMGMKDEAQQTALRAKDEAQHGVERVRAEATANGKKAAIAVGMYAVAGVLALVTFGVLTAAFIAALAEVLPVWGAALVVAIVYAVIIGILAVLAKKRLNDALPLVEPATIQSSKDRVTSVIQRGKDNVTAAIPPKPEQTIETIKEDVEWAKNQPRSDRT
jgi:hypothetical protein